MTSTQRPSAAGFSLIELMVVVAIVAILGSLAVSTYSSYVRRANRSDATRSILLSAQALQRCYSQNFTYQPPGGCSSPAGTKPSLGGYYSITIAIPTATTYTIQATPLTSPQTLDTQCVKFTINSAGVQSALNSGGTDATKTCWGAGN